jgi:hypothetical protein
MKRRWRLWLGLALLLIVGASLLQPAVYWRIIGRARGEAFYQGMPTSYWKNELRRFEMMDFFLSGDLYFRPRPPTSTERWLRKHLGIHFAKNPFASGCCEDPAVLPVLMELLGCEDPQVQLIAIQSLAAIGPEARPAGEKLCEVARTTPEYLVYREAGRALWSIDPAASKERGEIRPDSEELWQRYQPGHFQSDP